MKADAITPLPGELEEAEMLAGFAYKHLSEVYQALPPESDGEHRVAAAQALIQQTRGIIAHLRAEHDAKGGAA